MNKVLNGRVDFAKLDLSFLKDKVILVTGGTGSFGKKFTETLLKFTSIHKLIILSRDEYKQYEMANTISDSRIRFFLGDVRNRERLKRAFQGVDYVIHAAALKQVPLLEYNPFEAVLTNVMGAQHVIDAAIDSGVEKVLALSTDKAVSPVNLYGATKLCAEKLFITGNVYAGNSQTRFSVVRYGNVVGSRGSVIPLFLKQRNEGTLTITDENMTRFWITLDESVALVLTALKSMHGGETFIPKIPSMKITDLAKVIAPKCRWKITGIRRGEKIHEVLMTDEEMSRAFDLGSCFVILAPSSVKKPSHANGAKPLPANFKYSSDQNKWWLSSKDLVDMVKTLP